MAEVKKEQAVGVASRAYCPIPVERAKAIADECNKNWVIIVGWDDGRKLIHTTTYGRDALDKVQAAKAGELAAKALLGDLARAEMYEDFRRDHSAARERAMQEAIEKHLPALKQMGAQIIHPSENTFTRMVADFERALRKEAA